MAFGESWGIIRSGIDQVDAQPLKEGPLGEAVFETHRPAIANSAIHLLDSVPIKSSFPSWACFLQSFNPKWRREKGQVDAFLKKKLAESRAALKTKGDSAVELADNTMGTSSIIIVTSR